MHSQNHGPQSAELLVFSCSWGCFLLLLFAPLSASDWLWSTRNPDFRNWIHTTPSWLAEKFLLGQKQPLLHLGPRLSFIFLWWTFGERMWNHNILEYTSTKKAGMRKYDTDHYKGGWLETNRIGIKGKRWQWHSGTKTGKKCSSLRFGDLPCCAGTIHLLALEQVHRKATVPSPQGALDQ